MSQMIAFGIEPVKFEVKKWLTKCAEMLDIALSPSKLDTLSLDILDKYKTDSLEDVRECLKKGRQGYYSDSRDSVTYGKLNMEVISKWMGHHLEEKSAAREQQVREERERSEEENSGDRLIDIIEFKRNKINQMIADRKPKEEIDKEYSEFMDLKEQLKENSFNLKKALERKKPKSTTIQDREQFEISRRKDQLTKWEILVKDSTDSELDDMLPTIKDAEMRAVCLDEIKRRTDGRSIGNPKEGREAVKG